MKLIEGYSLWLLQRIVMQTLYFYSTGTRMVRNRVRAL